MAEDGALQPNGVWKWIAAILVALMLGGMPGYLNLLIDRPSRAEVNIIRERQDNVLQRLAVLEERVEQLREELTQHEQSGG